VTGTVPDVRPYLERASAFVVPLRVGGGTRLKIYEALAMELPLVSTAIGAEGLPMEHGTHALIADDAPAFAEATLALLRDPAAACAMALAGAKMVREGYGWDRVAMDFAALVDAPPMVEAAPN
jgi:glycosyltransferase involved in cell wall biosynthesis